MKRRFAIWAALAILGISSQALAIFEARFTYGALASSPDLTQIYTGTGTLPSTVPNYGVGGDLLVFIPLTGIGLGVRYENLGITATANGISAKSTATRTAAVLAYRLIDTILHIGPIFTYGISHNSGFSLDDNSAGLHYSWAANSTSSYSAGLEANVSLLGFLAGAEVGYESMKWNGMSDSTGTSAKTPNLDMSGSYGKVYVGIGI